MNQAMLMQSPTDMNELSARKSPQTLQVPTRVVLNESGAAFFEIRNRGLHRFEVADGGIRFGFLLPEADFAWLKGLIAANFVEKIEIQAADLALCKAAVIDFTRLVFFGMLKRRALISATERVFDSELIRRWNRSNPKRALGLSARLDDERIRSALARSAAAVSASRRILEERLQRIITTESCLSGEERAKATNFAREALRDLAPLVIFVLIGSVGSEREALHDGVVADIHGEIRRWALADLCGLLGLELASAAERSALVRNLIKANPDEKVRNFLGDYERRAALLKEKSYRGSTIVAAFPGGERREKRRLRFRFSVFNDGADIIEERRLMEDFGERSGGASLEERLASGHGIYGDDGLCFYYQGLLSDLCAQRGVAFDAFLREVEAGGTIATTMRFGL